ncbi:MAG: type II secretion system protein GspL [Pseudomonadota bacterium]
MAQYLLTYLHRVGDDYLRWAVCDDRSKSVDAHDHGSFADAAKAAERRRVVMVIAGTELLLEEAEVPVSNLAKAIKAIPYALEDQLAQDVETSHFSFGAKMPDGRIPVAVMAMDGLDWVLDQCEAAGLSVAEIIPEPYALPLEKGRITVMTNDGHAAVRQSSGKGFSCDADMLMLLLDNTQLESENSAIDDDSTATSHQHSVADALHFSCGPDRYDLATTDGPVQMRSEVELFATGLAQAKARNKKHPYINLLQGEYSKTEAIGKAWKPWRVPAALAATLVALWGGNAFLQYQALGVEQQRLQSEMAGVLKSTFPGVRNPDSDPVRQMRSRIKALAAGTGAIDDGNFIVMMSAVGTALKEANNPTVKSMNYRSGKLDIELEAASLQDIDKIKSRLEADKKLIAAVRSATINCSLAD